MLLAVKSKGSNRVPRFLRFLRSLVRHSKGNIIALDPKNIEVAVCKLIMLVFALNHLLALSAEEARLLVDSARFHVEPGIPEGVSLAVQVRATGPNGLSVPATDATIVRDSEDDGEGHVFEPRN